MYISHTTWLILVYGLPACASALVVVQLMFNRIEKGWNRELEASEKQFRTFFENSSVGMIRISPERREIVEANSAFLKLFHASTLQDLQKHFSLIEGQWKERVESPVATDQRIAHVDLSLQSDDGQVTQIAFSGWINPLHGDIEGVAIDVTEQKRMEELRKTLTQRLVAEREEERKRIAHALHDSVNQMLSGAKYRLHQIESNLLPSQLKMRSHAEETISILETAMNDVRRIAYNLRPSVLDDLGLIPATRRLCREFAQRTNVGVTFFPCETVKRLHPNVELFLYRFIQEGLTNVEKHSEATQVDLELQRGDSAVIAHIKDNGRGFDVGTASRGGLGLRGLTERVYLLGGELEIISSPGRGSEFVARIPVSSEVAGETAS